MWIADNWKDYQLLETSDGDRLERWGEQILIRPDPQAIWQNERSRPEWKKANAVYHRSGSGGGHWEIRSLPESWKIGYRDLKFQIKPMNFKHTGIFPEQAVNWDFMRERIEKRGGEIKVLNLFAYTGGATMACSKAGASVVHVDASKGMVQWAKENAVLCGVEDRPIRYLVDDCMKFVEREIRRGNTYDGIVMDPPSYGRGPGGEVWQLEDKLYPFMTRVTQLLSKKPLFFILNSYSTGLSASVMEYLLRLTLPKGIGGRFESGEIGLRTANGMAFPSGSVARWFSEE
ncbi:MAG: class I SAM-dependent methyltransferase [Clostridia bacterium]|nr:class I SAM-dependent methyltransferase [Clostridia bacterium]MBQ7090854.1 class I SAM-dependent methyltransferase [Clostridia bacterium]